MRIAHLSDLHIDSSKDEIYGVKPYENLLRAISLLESYKDIDFAVITGDISNDGCRSSCLLADKAFAHLRFPVYIINGNHDNAQDIFETAFSKFKYNPVFSKEEIDFISVNTVAIAVDGTNRSRGVLPEGELGRVKSFIAKGERKKIILMHHPATETGSWLDRRILENRQLFIDCVSSSDKVIAVLSGHNHYSTKERIGNCLYCTAPSVSTSFDKDLAPFEEAFQPGFNILTIERGRCDVETIRI